ncbi:MAG: CPBP family intramembrane metalloprotease [Chlamydiae bacterium]|nr:CPBP family intramembrane metalloprotease [Chlamydiota bacterium]
MDEAQGHIGENIETIVLFAILALFLNMIAKSKGFFTLPPPGPFSKQQIFGRQVASCFGIYLSYSLLLAPFITYLCKLFYTNIDLPVALISWVQFSTISLILITLFVYAKRQDRTLMKRIWKDYSLPNPSSPLTDWVIGALTWVLGFPVVVVVGELCDTLIYLLFGMQPYEQVAVRYLKMTLESPPMLIIALFTILIAAPVIEEFLFRGMLQTWLKNRLGTKAAILIASMCFALFHLAASQGLGNISLALSLFSFACFLGFIYEKKGSLFASIGLHMTFNAVSTLRILFFSET